MAKFKPGIPDTFTLNVDPVRDLGDYLDEPRPAPVPRKAREEVAPATPEEVPAEAAIPLVTPAARAAAVPPHQPLQPAAVIAAPVPEPVVVAQPVVSSVPAVAPATPQHFTAPLVPPAAMTPANAVPPRAEPERRERGGKEKAPRREISMTPETLRMSDELLEVIRSGSGQRDTKANELFHALVLLVHEVRDEIDPHAIPKRGRWGTPTARAYPLELKNAFLRALLEKYGEGAKYPVGSAA